MKRSFLGRFIILLTVTLLASVIFSSVALADQSGSFTYKDCGTYQEITGYTGPGGAVTIPSAINGKKVTSIVDYAFESCTSLTSVVIPNTVTDIGIGAFSSCTGLVSITLPNKLTRINEGLCFSCSNLKKINIPNSVVYIGDYSFSYCNSLTSIAIPNSVTSIYSYSFAYCTSLKSITIPGSVTEIDWGFYGCSSLTKAIFLGDRPYIQNTFDFTAKGFKVYYPIKYFTRWMDYYGSPRQAYCFVTIDLQNGSTVSKVLTNVNNGYIQTPATPTRTGYTFKGWYKESACITALNFTSTKIIGDIKIYAKWIANTYSVKFQSPDGSTIANKSAIYNSTITPPAQPKRAGYSFIGWYKEAGCVNAWNFSTCKVTANLTLYSKWKAVQ